MSDTRKTTWTFPMDDGSKETRTFATARTAQEALDTFSEGTVVSAGERSIGVGRAATQGAVVGGPAELAGIADLAALASEKTRDPDSVMSYVPGFAAAGKVLGGIPEYLQPEGGYREAALGHLRDWYESGGRIPHPGRPDVPLLELNPDREEYVEPENLSGLERVAHGAGTGATAALPFAALAPGGLAAKVGYETLSGGLGGGVYEATGEAGIENPWVRGGAAMLAGLSPYGVARAGQGLAGAATQRGARNATGQTLSEIEAERQARGVLTEAVGGEQNVPRAVELIDEELLARTPAPSPDPVTPAPGRATTIQALSEEFPGVDSTALSFGRDGGRAARRLEATAADARGSSLDEIAGRTEEVFPEATDVLPARAEGHARAAKAAEQDAWRELENVDLTETVEVFDVAETAAQIRRESTDGLERYVPTSEAAVADSYVTDMLNEAGEVIGQTADVPVARLVNYRKALNARINDLERMAGTSEHPEIRNLMRLKESVDRSLREATGDTLSPETMDAIRTAYGTSARRHAHWDPKHPHVQAFLSRTTEAGSDLVASENPVKGMRGLLSKNTATREARRLLSAIEGDEAARDGAARLVFMAAIDGSRTFPLLTPAQITKARRFLTDPSRGTGRAANVILGSERYTTTLALLDRLERVTRGRIGTSARPHMAGSALEGFGEVVKRSEGGGLEALGDAARAVGGDRGAIRRIAAWSVNKATQWIGDNTTELERMDLLADAFFEPRVARDLLLDVNARNMPEWIGRMEGHLERIRAQQAAAGGIASDVARTGARTALEVEGE